MIREFTVVMVVKENRVLLGYKKTKIGKGLWVGFGGKVEPGETYKESAGRELKEEVGLEVLDIEYAGVVWATHEEHDELWKILVYRVMEFKGEPVETGEMRPEWFAVQDVPYDQMWEGDRHWMPMFLTGKIFEINEHYKNTGKVPELLHYELREALREKMAV